MLWTLYLLLLGKCLFSVCVDTNAWGLYRYIYWFMYLFLLFSVKELKTILLLDGGFFLLL